MRSLSALVLAPHALVSRFQEPFCCLFRNCNSVTATHYNRMMHRSPSKEVMAGTSHRAIPRSPSKEATTSSTLKNATHLTSTASAAPTQGSPRRLRKLQSAHQLSSNYTAVNTPSLISQQRQQQQRNTSPPRNAMVPPIPALPSIQKHNRPRSNSDVPSPRTGPSLRRNVVPKRIEDPKAELKSRMRRSPKGDVLGALEELRHLILIDGLEADSDGMVSGSIILP